MDSERKLLVIGLDAVEAPVLLELMCTGRAPNLAALDARSLRTPVEASCMSRLPGAVWQDLGTGRRAGAHGDYYPERVHTGEAGVRTIDCRGNVGRYWFELAATAGHDVVAVDLPLVPPFAGPDRLTLVAEWHVHDAIWARGTHPQPLLAELEARFGVRPYDRCDLNHGSTNADLEDFARTLQHELRVKIDMVEHLLTTRPWDVAAIGISQGHCAGHQTWHLHTAANGRPGATDPLADVYVAIDAAIGRLIEIAGDDTDVVVFTSHGMGEYIGGPQLLPVLLERWGYGDPRPHLSLVRRVVPRRLVDQAFRRAPKLLGLLQRRGTLAARLDPTTRAIAVPNNRVGAIRLNVAGREPHGTITDVAAELDALERRLLALRDPGTGEPIVDHVVRPADEEGPDHHPDLPDLLVVFRRDLGPLIAADCPTAGHVAVPIQKAYYPRTGDHSDSSWLWIDHHDVASLGPVRSIDVPVTLLDLLDVPARHDVDGRVVITRRSAVPA